MKKDNCCITLKNAYRWVYLRLEVGDQNIKKISSLLTDYDR